METPTLAAKLGTTTHLSPLLRKARRLGLDAEDLERLAIQRGCEYYDPGEPFPAIDVSTDQLSNAELAIALLNPALRYDPQTIRLGAAMLSAGGNTPEEIARLASMERSEGRCETWSTPGGGSSPKICSGAGCSNFCLKRRRPNPAWSVTPRDSWP